MAAATEEKEGAEIGSMMSLATRSSADDLETGAATEEKKGSESGSMMSLATRSSADDL